MQMGSVKPTTCSFLTFVLILVSIISASDRSSFLISFSNEAKAVSENELELNCENNEELCLVAACIGRECSTKGKEIGISQLLSGDRLLGYDPMRTDAKDNCRTHDEKEEISNFNFRATEEKSGEPDSSTLFEKSSQIPAARWDHSGSDILIGMDLGAIKKICNIDVHFNDDAEIQNGFSLTVSNGTNSLLNVASEPATGSFSKSWSSHDFKSLAGRFIQLMIPGVSEFYVDDDADDPVISEINVKTISMIQTTTNSSGQSNSTDNVKTQIPSNTLAQHELSPLEFLDAGSDLLNTPVLGPEKYGINQSSLPDMSSSPTSNMYTGDIFLP
jgi:hypothetical protein